MERGSGRRTRGSAWRFRSTTRVPNDARHGALANNISSISVALDYRRQLPGHHLEVANRLYWGRLGMGPAPVGDRVRPNHRWDQPRRPL